MHTLSILMTHHDNEGWYVIGCAGGDLRLQIHAKVFTSIADYKFSLSRAVDTPRLMLIERAPIKALAEEDLGLKRYPK